VNRQGIQHAQNNIKLRLSKIGWEFLKWIHVPQDRDR
jgi:hypothetical protein